MNESKFLTVEKVDVTFDTPKGPLTVLEGASFDVARGETLGLVGESGCGKSSLARALAGVLQPKAGSVRLGGSPLGWPRPQSDARSVQMVFQDPWSALNPRHSARRLIDRRGHESVILFGDSHALAGEAT